MGRSVVYLNCHSLKAETQGDASRDKLLQQFAVCGTMNFWSPRRNFVPAIYPTNSNWLEFVRLIVVTKRITLHQLAT